MTVGMDIKDAKKQREREQQGAAKGQKPQENGQDKDASEDKEKTGAASAQPLDIIGAPELVGWPELTPACVPEAIHDYAMNEAERMNADPCALVIHVLAACSSSCSDAWHVQPKFHDRTWTQQPRIWVCLVKDIGGRGTDTLRAAFWPIDEHNMRQVKQYQCDLAAWHERKAARKKGDRGNDPEPVFPPIMIRETTVEAASAALVGGSDCAKLTILCDELAGWLGGFGRYNKSGGTERALWLEAYDGGQKYIRRIIRGNVYVPNWSVVVAGNIQPRLLAEIAPRLITDGLFQRFTTIHAKPSEPGLGDDVPLNTEIGGRYRDLHQALRGLAPPLDAKGEIAKAYFDEDARDVRKNFIPLIERLHLDPTLPNIIRETAPKWSGLLARLALIFHLVELASRIIRGEEPTARDLCAVSGPTALKAATFIRKIILPNLYRLGFESMPDAGGADAHARWIAGYILAHKLELIRARDIGRAYRSLRGKPTETAQVMDVLCDAGWTNPVPGRHDSMQWAVNPAVHTLFEAAAKAERERREKIITIIRTQASTL